MIDQPRSTTDLADIRTELAGMRSVQAANRTLMAWIRTALSCFSFGFTIFKVFEGFVQAGKNLPHPNTPQNAGMFLISLGIFAIASGILEYWHSVKEVHETMHGLHRDKASLRRLVFRFIRRQSAMLMAIVLLCAGVFMVIGIFSNIL